MRINTNVAALDASRNLSQVQDAVGASVSKLSSGFRITRAADDAAGLGIANKFRADGRALTQASKNAEQVSTLLQIAEGGVNTVEQVLERMKELAAESGSDTVDSAARSKIQAEFTQLRDEIKRTVNTTKFQGKTLLDGSFSNKVDTIANGSTALNNTFIDSVQISGVPADTYKLTIDKTAKTATITNSAGTLSQTVSVSTSGAQDASFDKFGVTVKLNASYTAGTSEIVSGTNDAVKVTAGTGGSFLVGASGNYTTGNTGDYISVSNIDLTTGAAALNLDTIDLGVDGGTSRSALTTIDTAISKVATALGDIGAAQNRVQYATMNLKSSIQNYAAAESVIRDVDMAQEMTSFSKNQILSQAGTAMLAQANQLGAGILKLLG